MVRSNVGTSEARSKYLFPRPPIFAEWLCESAHSTHRRVKPDDPSRTSPNKSVDRLNSRPGHRRFSSIRRSAEANRLSACHLYACCIHVLSLRKCGVGGEVAPLLFKLQRGRFDRICTVVVRDHLEYRWCINRDDQVYGLAEISSICPSIVAPKVGCSNLVRHGAQQCSMAGLDVEGGI